LSLIIGIPNEISDQYFWAFFLWDTPGIHILLLHYSCQLTSQFTIHFAIIQSNPYIFLLIFYLKLWSFCLAKNCYLQKKNNNSIQHMKSAVKLIQFYSVNLIKYQTILEFTNKRQLQWKNQVQQNKPITGNFSSIRTLYLFLYLSNLNCGSILQKISY
jgi:hypothetical protein